MNNIGTTTQYEFDEQIDILCDMIIDDYILSLKKEGAITDKKVNADIPLTTQPLASNIGSNG